MKDRKETLSNKNENKIKMMINHEELVGGCCVCSDDQGFANNALVYCDGKYCKVACHTACYGIVSIPDGDWYCQRCEAGEIHAPCRLCPLIEGAMKRTSDNGWAHVICALYIPEVSFGNDATMEPIILSKIPSTRYGQICSICLQKGRSKTEAMKGTCCECTVKNCPEMFHVTCAQQEGLLYEDVRKNTCQYPIYCHQHQPKFSKFLRQIPAFHYKSSEQKKNKTHRSDSFQRSSIENQTKFNDETSQMMNSLDNLSQFVQLNKDERTNKKQTIIENRQIETNDDNNNNNQSITASTSPIIKTEENTIDHSTVEKMTKKRTHPVEGPRRPVGRPPSKKKLIEPVVVSSSSSSSSVVPSEFQTKPIEFYPRRPLSTQTSSIVQSQRSFPPETLAEFLEQEWESSSDFLLQQTMPHDVSSLLSCLYQFKSENASLEKQYDELKHRRDNLRLTNANLRRKLSDISSINDSSSLPKKTSSKISSTEMEYQPKHSTSFETMNSYSIIKNERRTPTNVLSLELLSQILTTSGPQLFAPTWNISNFGYANFPEANSISVTDDTFIRLFEQ